MRIVNGLDRVVHYELRGGELRMTMSECDLDPGEVEVWENPLRGNRVELTLIVTVDGTELVTEANQSDTVTVSDSGGGVSLVRSAGLPGL